MSLLPAGVSFKRPLALTYLVNLAPVSAKLRLSSAPRFNLNFNCKKAIMHTHRLKLLARALQWPVAASLGLLLAACGGGGNSDSPVSNDMRTTLSAAMSGDQEPTPTATGALGYGTLTLSLPSRALAGSVTLDGMVGTVAHIHDGVAGVNSGVIVPLAQTSAGSGTWEVPAGTVLTEAQATAFANGGLYFNAHSAANPGGEIRGQIGRQVFAAQLSAAQELPTNASTATGNGVIALDPGTKAFTARLTLSGISAVAAHIHTGAIGANGAVIFPLTETATGSGVWVSAAGATMTDAQVASLTSGGLYFNAHSAGFPGGEIRGQIARNVRFAKLSAAEELPTNASTATGTGTLVVDPTNRMVSGSIVLTGITATMAHIHLGAPGANGAVIVPLTQTTPGTWSVPANTSLTADQLKAYKQGNLYFNAHSAAFPGGEIRGQIR